MNGSNWTMDLGEKVCEMIFLLRVWSALSRVLKMPRWMLTKAS